ncbi:hypothetical protein E2562_035451 [Oryza meyeriana var. granulata]|uniref:Expansin-like EG45 domain-containing protein n=1 Tax=Oryza meyeriana var. granulata TaxID=110450 RepID=A0A6G1CWK1_9ORYZ|nr:hypothetical protein E2562_035451 [Oryza meyeriana var. granulata]
MIAAASDKLWDGGKICGKMFTARCVKGTNAVPNPWHGGTITPPLTVTIFDHCPGCNGTLDLSKEAFAAIGNSVAGKIVNDYQQYARAQKEVKINLQVAEMIFQRITAVSYEEKNKNQSCWVTRAIWDALASKINYTRVKEDNTPEETLVDWWVKGVSKEKNAKPKV